MENPLLNNYNLENLVRITTKRFGFELFTTPQYQWKFTDIVFEEMTALLVRQTVKGVNTFIDVGAHNGFYDVLVGLSNPNCKSFAFEPVAENIEVIKKNLLLNDLKLSLHNVAVSDHPGRLPFQVSEATSQSGFRSNPDVPILKNIDVDVVALDQFLEEIPAGPVLVKIDTEGSETKVLAGMQKLINKVEDLRLVIEINPTCLEANGSSARSLLDQLDQLGFDVFVIFDMEMKYAKYHPGSDWNEHMGERTYRNVLCIKKNRSLNICAFSHSGSLGGAEAGLLELADSLIAKHGAIFTIILPSDGALKNKFEERGGATMIIPYHWWCASVLLSASQVNDLMLASYENIEASLASIERISPDVILTNTMVIPWGALSALMLDLPHIWWVKEFGQIDHNLEFFYTFQKTIEIIKESSNHIVVNSNSVKNILFPELGPEDCTVAINNVSLAAPTPYKETYFRYSTSTKIVIAGNIARAKGQDQAVHAVKKLIQSKHDVELCIVGGVYSSFGENLKSLVKMEGLEDRVHFVGFIENICSLLEQADINLMCSENEAFGRVTAEAMLLGLPVIGTNTGGTVELIDDGETGFLYSPGDVNELANKIIFFIDHPEKIKEFGERAQKSMTKKLAVNPADMVLSQYFQNYKDDQNKKSLQLFQMTVMWQAEVARKHRDLAQEKDKTIQLLRVQNEAFTTQIAEKEQTVLALTAQAVKLDQKDAQLHEILDSRVWKIVLFFRRIRILSYSLKKYLTRFIQRSINFFFRPIKRIKRNITYRRNLALIRSSDLFDETFYLVNNPDVAQTMQDPLSHYLYVGGFKGRDPGPVFDSDWYLDTYEDVKKSGINPLVHYLRRGKKEGRAVHLNRVNPTPIVLNVGDMDDFDRLKQKLENLTHYEFLKGSQTNESSRDTVLIVCHEASLTGAPILGINLAQNLKKKYNVVSLLLADGPIRENFCDVSVFEIVGSLSFRYDIVLIGNMIDQMTKLFKFKFAIVNSIESRAVLPALANRFVPIINLIHEFASYTRPREVFPEAILWSQETIFSASMTRENALFEYPELVDHPFHIIPQGRCVIPAVKSDADSQQIEAVQVLKELRPESLPADTVVVLGIGTIQLRKGVDLFIECASRVVQSGHSEHCRFVWIGKGYDPEWDVNYSVYIADQIRRSGLQQHVFFMEETSNIEAAYKAADILLISSRLDPLPNVAFDAMIHGLPIICFAKTTGIADILIANHLGEECVAPYLDTVEMAAKINVFIESKAMRQKVGEQLRQLVLKEFNMEHYVRQLEDLAQVARDDVVREQKDFAEISKSLQIRLDFFLPPHMKNLTRDEAIRYYVRSWKAGIYRRKIIPGFHPGIFLEQGGPGESKSNPLANYLRAGQPDGPWSTDVIASEDIVQPLSSGSGMRIALHLHIYYLDLLEEILNLLTANIVRPDLFVSVPTESVRDEVDDILKNYSGKLIKIQVVPNRGRDIGPFLTAFGRTFVEHYDLVGHFHTKRTADLQDQEMGNNWRKFLLENLLGGKSNMADIILGRMSTDHSIGMVFPDDPNIVGWGGNKIYAEDLGQRLGLNNALPEFFLFPIGTMFWARVEALRPIFDLGLDWQDYPIEPLPYDGSILHGLERIFPFVVAKQGFRSILTNIEGITR